MIPENYAQFVETLENEYPNDEWSVALKAMWFDAVGDWETSHNIAQDLPTTLGSWIHAYLHRKEGDEFNAGYWYRRAARPFPNISMEDELQLLVEWIVRHDPD